MELELQGRPSQTLAVQERQTVSHWAERWEDVEEEWEGLLAHPWRQAAAREHFSTQRVEAEACRQRWSVCQWYKAE